jgi:hypothetical protein
MSETGFRLSSSEAPITEWCNLQIEPPLLVVQDALISAEGHKNNTRYLGNDDKYYSTGAEGGPDCRLLLQAKYRL